MRTIQEILDDNIDAVNELIDAAFHAGCSTDEMPHMLAEAIRDFSEKAIYARTLAYKQMDDLDSPQRRKKG